MLLPHLSFLSAQQRSVCCLTEYDENDDDDDQMRYRLQHCSAVHGQRKLCKNVFIRTF